MNERYLLRMDLRRLPAYAPDIVIVGSGIAAASAALAVADEASVMLVTKGIGNESNTFYAQGGIAAALDPQDHPDDHFSDTIRAGAGLCDEAAVRKLVNEGPVRVQELIDWGTPFDREADEKISLTLEGGHGRRRILHAFGDATGRAIADSLLNKVSSHPNITILDRHFAVDLLHRNRTCYGLLAFDTEKKLFLKVEAKATILASGGLGQIYRETTNPELTTGDGIAMAFRAGATVQDMEFIQFHPTTLYVAGARRFLISEAVRGEGAYLINEAGERFMLRYDERAELAPRDIVAHAIYREMGQGGATNVYLTLAHLDRTHVIERFPTIYNTLKQYGLDLTQDRIPVRPACHYAMGGVRTDQEGRTDVARLFAAGEVASCGLHGANRLASNSLLDGLVFGYEAGRQALKLVCETQEAFGERQVKPLRERQAIPIDVDDVRASMRSLMGRAAGIVREGTHLQGALKMLAFWQNYVFAEPTRGVSGYELVNMLVCSRLVATMALQREESRGTHARLDFPKLDNQRWKKHQTLNRQDFE